MSRAAVRLAARIDAFSTGTGNVVAWLTLLMVLVTVIVVVLRYAFDVSFIWLQESVTWMHGAVFMLGAAYTLSRDEHVRVDVFYGDLDARRRAWVDAAGVVLFLAPLCVFFLYASYEYVSISWAIREESRDAGGLPYPFIPLSKSILLVMPLLVLLQGISMLLVAICRIRGGDSDVREKP